VALERRRDAGGGRTALTDTTAAEGSPGRSAVRVLVLNAGSSSIKASVVGVDGPGMATPLDAPPPPLARAAVERDDGVSIDPSSALPELLARLAEGGVEAGSLVAVAHRVVHGGARLTAPTLVDDDVIATVEALSPLAPLHNPVGAATIRVARAALPDVPHVACFDTAFHASLPEVAWRYPVPDRWFDEWGVRRFGFHGLAVEWAVERAAALLLRPAADLGLVVAHLGSGSSITAVGGGRSVWTSMGMTPLEGVMMGSRGGSLDPGVLIQLLEDGRLDLAGLRRDLERGSGLLGVSGRSADVRDLESAAAAGDERSRLALEMFADRAAAGIAAAASRLARLDAVVFSGGIGENAGRLRADIVGRLAVLGLAAVEPVETGVDRVLGAATGLATGGPVAVRVHTREDVVAARQAAYFV
jgi:acetate kinase